MSWPQDHEVRSRAREASQRSWARKEERLLPEAGKVLVFRWL